MNKKMYFILIGFALISGFIWGVVFGRYYTIRQAELLGVNADEYYISFGGNIHTYSNDMGVE